MKQTRFLILYTMVAAILMIGCTGKGDTKHMPQSSDTLYTEAAAMDVYGTQPERALEIIDSAEIVGNLTEDRASMLRAKVFCLTCGEERLDTALQICESLLQSDFVNDAPENHESVLDLLVAISRKKQDNELWLRWATEKADFCRQQGNETEALRTEAEIGIILTHLGRQVEGLAKLDDVIHQLDGTRKFNETDACIISLRRKVDVLTELGRFADIIPLAEKIVEKMNDYEQHPDDFHDGTYREPNATDVPDYCDFYRTKGYAYLASAYSSLTPASSPMGEGRNGSQILQDSAWYYLHLFEQSRWGQTIDGRKMIAPTWCKLGDYDKMLATYDELEQHMGADTICFDYATILYNRAVAAEARGHHAQAYDYMSRYAALSQSLNTSLQASEAHEYAARYHAQEQQLQIEREQDKSARKNIYIWSFVIIALLSIAIAALLFYRNCEIKRKNRILAQQIAETAKLSEENRVKNGLLSTEKGRNDSGAITDTSSLATLSDVQLFQFFREVIISDQLFLDPRFDRQQLIDRFHLNKDRIGAAFKQGSEFESLIDFLNDCRLTYSTKLLATRKDLSIGDVATASGFANINTFGRNFKRKFTLTPSQYRDQLP